MNNNIFYLSIIFLFSCLHPLPVQAVDAADNLRIQLKELPQNDTTRLVYLRDIALVQQSTHSGLEAAQNLYKEAERFNNDKYKCYAFFYVSLYYYNNRKTESLSYYAYRTMELAEKEGMWPTYFESLKLLINSLIQNHEYEYSIREVTKMYEKAQQLNYSDGIIVADYCMAKAYIGTNRTEEAIQLLKETYKKTAYSENHLNTIEVLSLLTTLANYSSNYEDLLTYTQDLEKTIEKHLANHRFSESYNSVYLFCNIHYAYYYAATGVPERALQYLEEASKYKQTPAFTAFNNIYYNAYSDYFYAIGEYDKAINMIDSSMIKLKATLPKDYYRQLIKKASILSKTGHTAEALGLYQKSLNGKDSLDRVLSGKQMEQIQEIYNVKKLQIENEQIQTNQRIILLIIIIAFTVLLIVFICRALTLRKKLKESEREMRDASRIAEEANEVKNLFLSNMSYNIRTPLNSVVGFSQLMALDPDMKEEQRKEYSTIVRSNTEVLLNLVNDVLDLSRLEAGMMKFNLQEYGVITLCQEGIYAAKSKGQPIQIVFHPEMEEQIIKVDTFRFNQLLISLLSNPTPCEEEHTITLTVKLDKSKKRIRFQTINSPIARSEFIAQEVTIRNDINILFLKRFGGTYKVKPESSAGPEIVFTYPLSISE